MNTFVWQNRIRSLLTAVVHSKLFTAAVTELRYSEASKIDVWNWYYDNLMRVKIFLHQQRAGML